MGFTRLSSLYTVTVGLSKIDLYTCLSAGMYRPTVTVGLSKIDLYMSISGYVYRPIHAKTAELTVNV